MIQAFSRYNKHQRVLIYVSIGLVAVLLAAVVILGVALLSGTWYAAPSNYLERQVIVANQTIYSIKASDEDRLAARFDRAEAFIEGQQYDKAERDLELLRKADPKNPRIFLLQGMSQLQDERYSQAILTFTQGLDLAKGSPEVARLLYEKLADTYQANGQVEQAYDAMLSGATISPASSVLLIRAGKLAWILKRFDDAAKSYVLALQYDKESVEARQGLRQIRSVDANAVERAYKLIEGGNNE